MKSSSFVSVQDVPTPTISNVGVSGKSPPPFALGQPQIVNGHTPSSAVASSATISTRTKTTTTIDEVSHPEKGEEQQKPKLVQNQQQKHKTQTQQNGNIHSNAHNHLSIPKQQLQLQHQHQHQQQTPRIPRFSSETATPLVVEGSHLVGSNPTSITELAATTPTRRNKVPSPSSSLKKSTKDYRPVLSLLPGTDDLSLLHLDGQDWAVSIIPLLLACDLLKTGAPLQLLHNILCRLALALRNGGNESSRSLIKESKLASRAAAAAAAAATVHPTKASISYQKRFRRRSSEDSLSTLSTKMDIKGIRNYGQTCFLNSVLQALASLDPFFAYLERIIQLKEEINSLPSSDPLLETTKSQNDDCFSHLVLEILQIINGGVVTGSATDPRYSSKNKYTEVDPRKLLKRIGETNSQFRSRYAEQQDAQELLQAMLGVIIADAQLDSTASEQHLRFLDDWNDDDMMSDDETLTVVLAGDEMNNRHQSDEVNGQSVVDWSPTNSVNLGGSLHGENSVLSLSGLLERLDERQKVINVAKSQQLHQEQQDVPQQQPEMQRTKGENGTSHHVSSPLQRGREEKKQEDFEISLAFASSNGDAVQLNGHNNGTKQQAEPTSNGTRRHPDQIEDNSISDQTASTVTEEQNVSRGTATKLSTSMQILKSTISSITPSPLSGWLGSTLRCCNCKHVRPIQNAPFLDIPVVPTSVPNYLSRAYHPGGSRPAAPNASPFPSCTLEQCLADFTSVEQVQDVECRACTIIKLMKQLEEEAGLLRAAIKSTEKKQRIKQQLQQQKKQGTTTTTITDQDETKYLREDLERIEFKLLRLQSIDPDEHEDDFDVLDDLFMDDDEIDMDPFFGVGEDAGGDDVTESKKSSSTKKKKNRLERCDAKKCLLLTRCPSILCCHVQRRYFDPNTNRMEKCVQLVEFPQILDLSPYCAYGPRTSTPWAAGSLKQVCPTSSTTSTSASSSSTTTNNNNTEEQGDLNKTTTMTTTKGKGKVGGGKMLYQLRSIIEHRGNAFGGHYICYRQNPTTGVWYQISDANVTELSTSWKQIRNCQAYMLFYEAI